MEKEEKVSKSAMAMRRCAKAALLLSALKSRTNSEPERMTNTEEEEEVMRSEIQDLKILLQKELKKMKFRASVTVLVLLLLMLFLFAFLLFIIDSVMNFHRERVLAD